MADFEINTNKLNVTADNFDKIQRELRSISSHANSVIRSTRWSIVSKMSAALSRGVVCANINNCANDMSNLSRGLRQATQFYLAYEKNVQSKSFGKAVRIGKSKSSSTQKEENWWERLKKGVNDFGNSVRKGADKVISKVKQAGKSLYNGLVNGAKKTWDFIKDTSGKIKDSFVNTYNYLKENYNNHGIVYDIIEYGKAGIKIIGGVASVVAAGASLFFSAGMSTPLALATLAYGVNGITNGIADIVNVKKDNYDKVGNFNLLKDTLSSAGSWVGEKLGNEDVGEAVGKAVYYAGSIYTIVGNIGNAVDKVKQLDPVKLKDAIKSANEFGKMPITKDFFFTDIGYLKWNIGKVEAYKPFFDYISNASTYASAGDKILSTIMTSGKGVQEVYNTVTGKDYSNPVLNAYDYATSDNPYSQAKEVIGVKDDVKDTWENIKNMYGVYKILSSKGA